jgi:hypothetical protein
MESKWDRVVLSFRSRFDVRCCIKFYPCILPVGSATNNVLALQSLSNMKYWLYRTPDKGWWLVALNNCHSFWFGIFTAVTWSVADRDRFASFWWIDDLTTIAVPQYGSLSPFVLGVLYASGLHRFVEVEIYLRILCLSYFLSGILIRYW